MLKMRNVADQPETLARVVEIIEKAGKPVSIEYVAYNSKLSWQTAKAILFRLVAEGRLVAQDTTKSWIFFLRKGQGGDDDG